MNLKLKQNNKVFFSDLVHAYINDKNEPLIGITSLMKKHGLGVDYSGIQQDVLDRAAKRGSAIHKMLEDYDNGNAIEDCPILKSYKELDLPVIASEYLVSDNKTVASSIDKVLEDYSLVDIKTTSELHIGALEWQLSIYAYLFEKQNKGLKVPHLYALHIKDDKCKALREINRLPDGEIIRLIECERKGEIFTMTPVVGHSLMEVFSEDKVTELIALENEIISFEAKAKEIKTSLEKYHERLYEFMINNNIDKMEMDGFYYTLKRPYNRTSLDTKGLQAQYPDIAQLFTKTLEIKGNVFFKLK